MVDFCRKQFASEKQIYRIQLALEELLTHLVLPQVNEKQMEVEVLVEYDAKNGDLFLCVSGDEALVLSLIHIFLCKIPEEPSNQMSYTS